MKFTANKKHFSEALKTAFGASAKSATGALSGVLAKLDGDTLTLTGYDNETALSIKITVDGAEDGAVVISDPKIILEVSRKMHKGIAFEVTEKAQILIRSGRFESCYPALPAGDYANLECCISGETVKLSTDELKKMLSYVNFAVASNAGSPDIQGVRFEVKDGFLWLCGTDGVRLAVFRKEIQARDFAATVPEKTIKALIKLLGSGDCVELWAAHNMAGFKCGNIWLSARTIDGKYLDYKRVCDFVPERRIKVSCKDFCSVLERQLPLIPEKLRTPVVFEFKDTLEVSVKTANGSAREDMYFEPVSGDIKGFKISFNPKYVIEALKTARVEEVFMDFKSETNPMRITSADKDFTFIIVPVRP